MHEYPIVLASLMLSNNKISAGAATDQVEVKVELGSNPRAMQKEGRPNAEWMDGWMEASMMIRREEKKKILPKSTTMRFPPLPPPFIHRPQKIGFVAVAERLSPCFQEKFY